MVGGRFRIWVVFFFLKEWLRFEEWKLLVGGEVRYDKVFMNKGMDGKK